MSRPFSIPRGALVLAGLLAMLLPVLLTACAGADASGGGSSPAAERAAAGGPSGPVLNVGGQQQDFETLLRASGALAGAHYKVDFVEFDSGPLVDAGFTAHRIDVGFMGDLPALLAAKSGLPVRAIAVQHPIGAWEYLLAWPGMDQHGDGPALEPATLTWRSCCRYLVSANARHACERSARR